MASTPNRLRAKRLRTVSRTLSLSLVLCLGMFGSVIFSAAVAAAEYTVQIGAFGKRPNPAFAERAAQHGELLVLRGDDGITRVSIGRFADRAGAREELARLQTIGYGDAYVASLLERGTPVTIPASPSRSWARTTKKPITQPTTQPGIQPKSSSEASTPPSPPSPPSPPRATRPATSQNAPTQAPEAGRVVPEARTIPTAPAAQAGNRTASGRAIVPPKMTEPDAAAEATSQAGRFRLRTHDTQSGETRDLEVSGLPGTQMRGGVVAGPGANDVPKHLRDKLVYLDGVPHIKDGDSFIPLNDAVDGK